MTASATLTEAQPVIELHVGSKLVHHTHFDRHGDLPPADDGARVALSRRPDLGVGSPINGQWIVIE